MLLERGLDGLMFGCPRLTTSNDRLIGETSARWWPSAAWQPPERAPHDRELGRVSVRLVLGDEAEPLERTSHALVSNGRVWLVDPVDVPERSSACATLGEPAAVLPAARPAHSRLRRHRGAVGVLHGRFPTRSRVALRGDPRPAHSRLAGNGAVVARAARVVVAEVVGTTPHNTGGQARVGCTWVLRPRPPGRIRGREPSTAGGARHRGARGGARWRGTRAFGGDGPGRGLPGSCSRWAIGAPCESKSRSR